jgi:hydroxymethylpyrimidine/phosphomethylpyrimidine kinase
LPPSGSDPDFCVDVIISPEAEFDIRGPRIVSRHTHGTGCTFAAAITAALALDQPLEQAIRGARDFVEGAIRNAPQIGGGHGPLNHSWRVY